MVRITPDWLTPASYGLNLYLAHRRAPTAAAAATTGNSSASGGAVESPPAGAAVADADLPPAYRGWGLVILAGGLRISSRHRHLLTYYTRLCISGTSYLTGST